MGETEAMKALAGVTMFVVMAGCGFSSESGSTSGDNSGGATPEEAVTMLLTSLEAGSCADVKEIVLTPATVDCEMIGTLKGSFADEGVDLADVTYTAGDIADGSGSVTTDWGNGDAADTWQVEKIDGVWKVVFDSVE